MIANPTRLPPVGTGGTPSTSSANGAIRSPPIASCQAVTASSGIGGGPNRRPSTVAVAIATAAAADAATPTTSSDAAGPSTSAATPATPTAPVARPATDGARPSSGQPRSRTTIGAIAPTAAATPPGRRSAAMNSRTKNTAMLSVASVAIRSRHPGGGRCRVSASRISPAGSARPAAASSGRSGGSSSVVTQ